MPKWFASAVVACGLMFAVAPILIAQAPYESTMGLVQKIFYVHLPSAWMFLLAAITCGVASVRYLFGGNPRHDRIAWSAAELAVLFGAITLVTGPLWARKAWGTWWQWDVRLTSSLMGWMVAVAYLLLRRYGGPGSDKLAAGLALFGMANVPFVYISVNYWRTIHPTTNVVPTLPTSFGVPLWFSAVTFLLLFVLLLRMRIRLEEQRSRLDALYLAMDEHR
ncbi:MAG TPA: cytochrome c biogenesis protein CcsA [Vicinamibacterales bacterium]|nr:cytochrome c biogenesis protein CcsA [Vicinamibacterales bacterium]